MGSVSLILLVEHSPPLYHAYFAMTIFLWVQICCEYQFLKALWRYMLEKEISYFVKFLASFVVSVFILEILVCGIYSGINPSSLQDTLSTLVSFWVTFCLVLLYAGEKLHEPEDLYLDFLPCWGYCCYLSSLLNTVGLRNTSFYMASMLVFVHLYFDACSNSR